MKRILLIVGLLVGLTCLDAGAALAGTTISRVYTNATTTDVNATCVKDAYRHTITVDFNGGTGSATIYTRTAGQTSNGSGLYVSPLYQNTSQVINSSGPLYKTIEGFFYEIGVYCNDCSTSGNWKVFLSEQ